MTDHTDLQAISNSAFGDLAALFSGLVIFFLPMALSLFLLRKHRTKQKKYSRWFAYAPPLLLPIAIPVVAKLISDNLASVIIGFVYGKLIFAPYILSCATYIITLSLNLKRLHTLSYLEIFFIHIAIVTLAIVLSIAIVFAYLAIAMGQAYLIIIILIVLIIIGVLFTRIL